ncbi:MAG: matrixin family metalloprotease [Gemmatimonadota bacterium]
MGRGLELSAIFAACLALCVPGTARAQMQSASGGVRASVGPALVVPRPPAYLGDAAGAGEPPHNQWHVGLGTESRSIGVFVEHRPGLAPWAAEQISHVLKAWNAVEGSPVRFHLTSDAGGSQVRVRWIDRFADSLAGLTEIETDPAGRISHATVTLALRHQQGLPMGPEFLRMVGLHEFGHVMGLPHSEDPRDVMHPGNRNLRLSPRDVGTTLRLYRAEK